MNETFRFFLLRFTPEELKQMVLDMYETDRSFFPYTFCFIANSDDKKTLLDLVTNW